MPITYQIPVSAAGKVINAAAAAGVKPEELCRHARVDLSALADLDNQMPFKQLIRLNECAAQLSSDDAFGLHLGEQTDAKTYGVLGYVTMNSQTYGEALSRLIRYQQIRTNAVKFSMDVIGAEAHLVYHYLITDVLPQNRRHESEEMLSTMLQVAQKLTGVDLTPREVHFEHAAPENVSEHKRIFRAPVLFNQSLTKLIFDESVLKLPLTQADLTLGSLLERQAEVLLAMSPRDSIFADQVRQLIREGLPAGLARIETICRKLGSSERTVQRKLREEGTSYKEIFKETQRDLSKFYLQKPEMAICEVSYLVGFSQTSAFHRAFRRWTGLTPKEFQFLQKQQTR